MADWRADIVTRLEGAGIGTFGVSIFSSSRAVIPMLPSGLATVHVLDTSGAGPEHTHNAAPLPAYENPSAVIVTRADTYATAYTRARVARSALFVRNLTINGTWYREITPTNEVHDINPDPATGQARASFTITGIRRP
jgi:hypothetical protein